MASVKGLKKEIDYLSTQIIADCIDFLNKFEDTNNTTILSIIDEAVSLNNTMLDRISHPVKSDNPKLVKDHYRKIRTEFIKELDRSYGKLEAMIKQ